MICENFVIVLTKTEAWFIDKDINKTAICTTRNGDESRLNHKIVSKIEIVLPR
tara:strand:- start:220 stop:378 length:159 start_codon:yes stop_codon:yes gene_type:complete